MIHVKDEREMIEIGETFLHQETAFSQEDVANMSEFDKYYETREMLKEWAKLPAYKLAHKELSLEIQGFNIS